MEPAGEPNSADLSDDPRHLHLWQIQAVRDIAVIAAAVLFVLTGYWLRSVTVPLLIALALAYLFEPIVNRATRRFNISRPAVVGTLVAAVGVLFAVATVGVALTVVQTVDLLRTLPDTVSGVIRAVDEHLPAPVGNALMEGLHSVFAPPDQTQSIGEQQSDDGQTAQPTQPDDEPSGEEVEPESDLPPPSSRTPAAAEAMHDTQESAQARQIATEISNWIHANLGTIFRATVQTTGGALSLIVKFVGSTIYILFTLFLIPFYFYAFSTGWPKLRDGVVDLFPVQRHQSVYRMLDKMDAAVSGFVRGRVVISVIMGVLFAVGWWLCGVPYWLLLGILTAILSMVPYLGGVGWPLAVGLLWIAQADAPQDEQMAWWAIVLWPSVVFFAVQLLEGYVLTPIISGKATNLGPVSVLVVVLAGGVVAGIYGMLLAIPVAACGKIVIMDVVVPRIKKYGRGEASDILPISAE